MARIARPSSIASWPRRLRVGRLAALFGWLVLGGAGSVRAALHHRAWGIDEGLPQISVNALVQGRDGRLMIGTFDGLVRFDGLRFGAVDLMSIRDRRVRSVRDLTVAADGAIWAATGAGLLRIEGTKAELLALPGDLPNPLLRCVVAGASGSVWAGLESGGLVRAERGDVRRVETGSELDRLTVFDLLFDSDGTLWAATASGLFAVAGGRAELRGRCPVGGVSALALDQNDRLLVGCAEWNAERGLAAEIGRPAAWLPLAQSIAATSASRIWVGTRNGLFELRGLGFEAAPFRRSLTSANVVRILEDREGNLWIGTDADGLHRVRESVIAAITRSDGLEADVIQAVLAARDGSVYLGSSCDGLFRVVDGHAREVPLGPSDRCVWSLLEARDGSLWVGTWGHGVVRRRPGGELRWLTAARGDLPSDSVLALAEDASGAVWIGTYDAGLARVEGRKMTRITVADGLPSDEVHTIVPARRGGVWVGMVAGGVAHIDGTRVERLALDSGLHVRSIYEDAAGTLWIGTYGDGLVRWRDGLAMSFGLADGLPNDVVSGIAEDDAGRLWLSTNRGIAAVSKAELEAWTPSAHGRLSIETFGAADGMPSSECNGGGGPTVARTRDGRLWFPTVRGVAIVDPRIPRTPPSPMVSIERILIDGQEVPAARQIVLAPGSRRLEVELFAATFLSPERIRYVHRLEGFDDDWNDLGAARAAVYTHLAPGEYRFEGRAIGADGKLGRVGVGFDLVVQPQLRQRPLFWALVVALVAAAVTAMVRIRMRLVRAESAVLAERNRLAREIHDSLAQDFTAIKMQLHAATMNLDGDPSRAAPFLADAAEIAQRGLEEAGRSVWALRRQAMTAIELEAAIRDLGRGLGSSDGSIFSVHRVGHDFTLTGRAALDLLRIAQEAISNAVRHGRPKSIVVELRPDGRSVELEIRDDGGGFDPAHPAASRPSGGVGLVSMRERARELGGELKVESAIGGGTKVVATIPTRGNVN